MEPNQPNRIASIDVLRGIVMIVMALDHSREFFHKTAMTANPMDPATATAGLYFTRWITHFCAPVFVFLAGVSAWLLKRKHPAAQASRLLIYRGIWLVLVEIVLVTFGITFNPYYNLVILQVIWAIGVSMILLGILLRFSNRYVLVVGIMLFYGHDIIWYFQLPQAGLEGSLWKLFLTAFGTIVPFSSTHSLGIFYAILPWTGVMCMGFSIGPWFAKGYPPEWRKRNLLLSGTILLLLFILLRAAGHYGDPSPRIVTGHFMQDLFSFLNASKYPPSLQFLGMTLGPSLILLAFLENSKSFWTRIVQVYGRVPFFYYILHIYLLHIFLVIAFFISGYSINQVKDPNSFMAFRPVQFGYPLWIVYAIWIITVASLYQPCRWYSMYKANHSYWWLKYL